MDLSEYQIYARVECVGEEPFIPNGDIFRFYEERGGDGARTRREILLVADPNFPYGFGSEKRIVKVFTDRMGNRVEEDDPDCTFNEYDTIGVDSWFFSYNFEMWSKETIRYGKEITYTRIDDEDARMIIRAGLWEAVEPGLRNYLLENFPELNEDLKEVEG